MNDIFSISSHCRMWWCTPLIPAIGVGVGGRRGRQISEFKASLVYKVSSRTARAIQRNPVSKNHIKKILHILFAL